MNFIWASFSLAISLLLFSPWGCKAYLFSSKKLQSPNDSGIKVPLTCHDKWERIWGNRLKGEMEKCRMLNTLDDSYPKSKNIVKKLGKEQTTTTMSKCSRCDSSSDSDSYPSVSRHELCILVSHLVTEDLLYTDSRVERVWDMAV